MFSNLNYNCILFCIWSVLGSLLCFSLCPDERIFVTAAQLVFFKGQSKIMYIPAVVAVSFVLEHYVMYIEQNKLNNGQTYNFALVVGGV